MTSEKAGALGQVVLIPVGDGRFVLGQVVGRHRSSMYITVYADQTVDDSSSVDEVLQEYEYILLGLVSEKATRMPTWRWLEGRPIAARVELPAYRLGAGAAGKYRIENHDATLEIVVAAELAALFPFRAQYDPSFIEDAAAAILGLAPWQPVYDFLVPNPSRTSAAIFGRSDSTRDGGEVR